MGSINHVPEVSGDSCVCAERADVRDSAMIIETGEKFGGERDSNPRRAYDPYTLSRAAESHHLHSAQSLAHCVLDHVAIMFLDHRKRRPGDLRYLKGTDAVQECLRNKAVTQGVKARSDRKLRASRSIFHEFVPITVTPRLAVVPGQQKRIGQFVFRELGKE